MTIRPSTDRTDDFVSPYDNAPYVKKPKGHVWQRDRGGHVDFFAYNDGEYHNGPRCARCGYGFCHHCQTLPDHECTTDLLEMG